MAQQLIAVNKIEPNEKEIMIRAVSAFLDIQRNIPNLNHLKKFKQLFIVYFPIMFKELEDLFNDSWALFEEQFPNEDIHFIYNKINIE
jgi:hypothetical protein